MNRLFNRRFPAADVYTTDQARELARLSYALGRQIGLLIDRNGRVNMVFVGKVGSILIPELPYARTGAERLRGLRLLHTHLTADGVSTEDLMDMLFLRLDAVIALYVSPEGNPVQWQSAHLLPHGAADKPYHVERPLPWDHTEACFAATAAILETEFARDAAAAPRATPDASRTLLVSVASSPQTVQERNLDELAALAGTAGLTVTGRIIQRVKQINANLILGKGKVAELEVQALQSGSAMLVFDGELTPAQLHNLSDITERKVIDRTQLILDIFAQHAVTKTGKLQVELAQLRYTQPRIVGKNRAMDRLTGGIGGRGPGETKLETDRRRCRERTTHIRKELEQIHRQRSLTRNRRSQKGLPSAALVGYTNAGKTTLLNMLTHSRCLVQNKLFATLDTTARRMHFPSMQEIIIADTVGFIRNLPNELREAFRGTLEKLEYADILIHVADASHPDLLQQISAVESILSEMEVRPIPRLLVFNKWDQVSSTTKTGLADAFAHALPVSAKNGEGLALLPEHVERLLTRRQDTQYPHAE